MPENIKTSGIRFLLVRHGETEWNRAHRFQGRTDRPLNRKGIKQARALALALRDESIHAIVSSPLVRAMETAKHIKKFHPSAPVFEEGGLMEMDLGDFEGMEAKKWASRFPEFRRSWEKKPSTISMPGGESLEEVQIRAMAALESASKRYPPKSTLLICSHNFVIISILCYALKTSFDEFRKCRQDTAALSILYKHGQRFIVEKMNDSSHLKHMDE